jgi:5'-deoxynucleotidase YfbR-like HD superfamily hydrolase
MERDLFYPLEVPSYCQNTVAKIINGLYKIPRTGFKDRGVLNPETVGQHVDSSIKLAQKLFSNRWRVFLMLKIHDWPEFILNFDPRTDHLAPVETRLTKEKKKELELEAMTLICESLGGYGIELFALWEEFEAGKTEDAQIAKQVEHGQSIFMAYDYEQSGQPVIAKEFYDYYKWEMTDPLMIEELALIGFN